MPDCSVRYLAGLEAESAVALVLTATAAAAISATKMRTTRFITGRTRVAAVFVARTGCLRRFYAPCRDSFTPGAKKRRPGRCDRAANVSVNATLVRIAATGKHRCSSTCRNFRKVREATALELAAESVGRHVDRGLRSTGEGEEGPASGPQDPLDLIDERDHVRVGDEVELAVLEGELGRICFPERRALDVLARDVEHRRGDVDSDDLRVGEALHDRLCPRTGAGSDVESPLDLLGDPAERRGVGSEGVRKPHPGPRRRKAIELQPDQRPEERPEGRPPDDGSRRQARESSAESYSEAARSRTSVPALTWKVSAALPRE